MTYGGGPSANTLISHVFSGAEPKRKLTIDFQLLTGAEKRCSAEGDVALQHLFIGLSLRILEFRPMRQKRRPLW